VYAPKTGEYHLDAVAPAGAPTAAPSREPVPGWWLPASVESYSRGGIITDVDFHQTDSGNAPEAMLINVWNMRFLRGETVAPGPAVLDAKLEMKRAKASNGADSYRLVGTIKNLTTKPLVNIRIGTWEGYAVAPDRTAEPLLPLVTRLEANAEAQVDAVIVATGDTAAPLPVNYGRYGVEPGPVDTSQVWQLVRELAGRRAHRADVLMQSGAWAAVYAERPDPDPPASLREPGAKQQHYELIRAVVPIAGDTSRPLVVPVASPQEGSKNDEK
jgi:hypothetical protein